MTMPARKIHRVKQWLQANFVFVLLLGIAFFAYQNAGFQKDNGVILKDTRATVQNTETIIRNLNQAVTDLKTDNERQTLILCRLIIRSNLTAELTPAEEAEVEGICQEEIDRQAQQDAAQAPVQPVDPPAPGPGQSDPPNSTPDEPNQPEQPQPEDGVVESIGGFVDEIILGPVVDLFDWIGR